MLEQPLSETDSAAPLVLTLEDVFPLSTKRSGQDEVVPQVREESSIDDRDDVVWHSLAEDDFIAARTLASLHQVKRSTSRTPVEVQRERDLTKSALDGKSPECIGYVERTSSSGFYLTECGSCVECECVAGNMENPFRSRQRR